MPIVDTYGTLDGTGSVTGTVGISSDLAGSALGFGDVLGLAVWWQDFSGSVDGMGDIAPAAAALAMPLGGPLAGSGDMTGDPAYWLIFSGVLPGTSDVSLPSPVLTFLVGGQMVGFGTIYDDTLQDVAGVVQGIGQLQGSLVVTSPWAGLFSGAGDIGESAPLPLQGFGDLAAFLEVIQAPKPVCAQVCSPKSFGYLQTLGKCDLTLCITDGFGNVFSPITVTYALYQVVRGGYRQLRGPAKRIPVMTPDGCYYAPFIAGDCGQPGEWCIVWTWQRARGFPCESRTECFKVLDQAMQHPCDPNRKRKFGWNC